MKYNITYLKDALGSNYLGIKIQETEVRPFLEQLKDVLGEQFDEYTSNQKKRDNAKIKTCVAPVNNDKLVHHL